MNHLEESAKQSDPIMMSQKQMAGVAIEMLLRDQMCDFDPDADDENDDEN